MDGVPNIPSGAPPDAPRPTITCPACGTTVPQARFCGACGADLAAAGTAPATSGPIAVPVEPTAADPAALAPMASTPPAQPAQPEPVAPAAAAAGPGKTCSWCDAVSPLDAKACVSCGATFPTPEGDEALERAARARIEEMQKDINKTRNSTWWPFRPR